MRNLFIDPTAFDAWAGRWRDRLTQDPRDGESRRADMKAVNPAFIPRNHRVEAALTAAVEERDLAPFEELARVLATPFEDQPDFARYREPPPPDARAYKTFCGT